MFADLGNQICGGKWFDLLVLDGNEQEDLSLAVSDGVSSLDYLVKCFHAISDGNLKIRR